MVESLAAARPLDVSKLPRVSTWAGFAPKLADVMGALPQLGDGEPEFDLEANPEIDPTRRLADDLATFRRPTRRLFVDYRSQPDAFRHLKRLPKRGESLHGVICGRYALFDLVPALIERTGESIADLYLVTLGFSKANGADLCGMLDDRQVRRVALVCSYYFQKTSAGIYDAVIPELLKRGQRVKAMRSHAKMLLARMSDGRRFVVESSANLRSCHNVEQFVMTCCPRLYLFHRRWLEAEILSPPQPSRRRNVADAS